MKRTVRVNNKTLNTNEGKKVFNIIIRYDFKENKKKEVIRQYGNIKKFNLRIIYRLSNIYIDDIYYISDIINLYIKNYYKKYITNIAVTSDEVDSNDEKQVVSVNKQKVPKTKKNKKNIFSRIYNYFKENIGYSDGIIYIEYGPGNYRLIHVPHFLQKFFER